MAKLKCKCGNEISNVISPSPNNAWLLSDSILENKKWEDIDIIEEGVDVWECRECGRIAFGNNHDNRVIWFFPEDSEYNSITR